MDIGKSISFVFEDKKWIEKVLIGGLIFLIPLIGYIFVLGYMVKLIRNVRADKEYPLPEWDEWGEKFVSGLKLIVIGLIWSIPLIIMGFPFLVLMGLAGDDFGWLFGTCLLCLAVFYGIFLFLASPAITIRYAKTEKFASGFEFSEIFGFTRDNIANIIIALIVIWLVQIVANFGWLLCIVGAFTGFWAMMVQGHLYGQIGLDDADASGDDYELSPGDVMPGVGELTDSVQDGADKATDAIADTSDSVAEAAGDVADATTDAGDAVDSAADTVSDAVDKATDSD